MTMYMFALSQIRAFDQAFRTIPLRRNIRQAWHELYERFQKHYPNEWNDYLGECFQHNLNFNITG